MRKHTHSTWMERKGEEDVRTVDYNVNGGQAYVDHNRV